MEKPGAFDYILLAVLIVGPLFEWLVFWPRRVQAIRAGTPGARARTYWIMAAAEWLVTLYVFGLWVMRRRSWNALWLGSSGYLRLDLGFLLAAIIIGLLWLQTRKILAKPKAIMHVREKMAFADPLVPETRAERRGFWLLSFTAGICEEVVFRGFLMWSIAAWTGLIAAVIISSILFGLGHIYLGFAQVPRTALVGLVLAIIVVASGSLWPAILIHAALDLNSGELGFRVRQASVTISESAPSLTS